MDEKVNLQLHRDLQTYAKQHDGILYDMGLRRIQGIVMFRPDVTQKQIMTIFKKYGYEFDKYFAVKEKPFTRIYETGSYQKSFATHDCVALNM